ncbi:hypothetical protein [Streptomyces otsuchiensis]|uniref:hypothetical protein n=1 Tax=Streptomyces otsuchiensis TaxID=2681388 RepID=UPI0010326073|nr:hypothetical protein [Streptomyces otsuchiensis]
MRFQNHPSLTKGEILNEMTKLHVFIGIVFIAGVLMLAQAWRAQGGMSAVWGLLSGVALICSLYLFFLTLKGTGKR